MPEPRLASTPSSAAMRQRSGESGVAVLLVIACLAIIAPFTASFNYQARVDYQSAINVRDEVAARSLQRGALQLSLLLFEIQRRVFNQKQFRDYMGTVDITQVAPYLMSVFGSEDGAEGIGALVGIDTSMLSELAVEGGSFEVRLMAESGKINVNCLAQQSKSGEKNNPAGRTIETLEALMAPQIYEPLFEEEKADGQYYRRADILQAIADYVDDDAERFDLIQLRSRGSQEAYRYEELFDPYQARNGRFDSVEELHLVAGIDDDWMAAFGHELTVYGECKVNLNFASAEQIALVLRHAVTEEDRHLTEGENFLTKTMPLANFIVQSRELSLFQKLEDFKDRVAKPDEFVNPLLMMQGQDEPDNPTLIPEGLELNTTGKKAKEGEKDATGGLSDIATVKPEHVYTLEVITTVGAVQKRLTAVYDMNYARAQSQGKGAWLYVREE